MTRIIAIVLLITTIVLTLSACGVSDSQDPPQNTDPGAESDHTQDPVDLSPSESVGNDEIVGRDTPDSEKIGGTNGEKGLYGLLIW